MAGNSAIWRATGTDGSEGAASTDELIEFNEGAVPNTTAHIITTEIDYDAEPAQNEKAAGQANEYQDVGFHTTTVVVTGSLETPNTTDVSGIIKKWLIEDKTNGTFDKGQFGLRLNDNPINNLTPVAGRGYILGTFKLVRPVEFQGKLDFIAKLFFNGSVGTDPYNW